MDKVQLTEVQRNVVELLNLLAKQAPLNYKDVKQVPVSEGFIKDSAHLPFVYARDEQIKERVHCLVRGDVETTVEKDENEEDYYVRVEKKK